MRVRFWGTRGSIAKPGQATLRYGGNTSCVEVRAADGTVLVLDCGTGAHALGKTLIESNAAARGHLLITHTHWDHIQGFPFFAPLRLPSSEWDVYGPRGVGMSLRDTLAGQMSYTYFPVELGGLDAQVRYQDLVEGGFDIGDVHVQARYLNHPAVTLGYRIEADGVVIVYATDHEPHSRQLALGGEHTGVTREDDAHAAFLEGADLVIHDTQYTAEEYPNHEGWGHSTVEYVVDRTCDKGIGRVALFHHDPMRDDDGVDRLVNVARDRYTMAGEHVDVLGAAEGMTLEVEPRRGPRPSRDPGGSARRAPEREAEAQTVVLCGEGEAALDAFRQAAAADDVPQIETGSVKQTLPVMGEAEPCVVVVERAALGRQIGQGLRRLLEAVAPGKPAPVVLGLVPDSAALPPSACGFDGVEWIETPVTEQYARTRLRAALLRQACRWGRARIPKEEPERLAALERLSLLDTPPEERFDAYTRLACALFRVPIALVTLLDRDRQWFKSRQGPIAEQTSRDSAFCAHTILEQALFQVTDARVHPDFADNPLVSGPPHMRFYAGMPLRSEGYRIGTLCLIDYLPRALDDNERVLLADLAKLLERELRRDPREGPAEHGG